MTTASSPPPSSSAPTLPYLSLDSPSDFSSLLRPSPSSSHPAPSQSRQPPTRGPLEPLATRFRLPHLVAPLDANHDAVLASFIARQPRRPPSPPSAPLPVELSQPRPPPQREPIAARRRNELLSWDHHGLHAPPKASSSAHAVKTQLVSEMDLGVEPGELDEAILDSITPLPASTLLGSKHPPVPAPSYPLSDVQASLLTTVQGHASTHFAWDHMTSSFVWSGKHHLSLQRRDLKHRRREAVKASGSAALDEGQASSERPAPSWVGSERIFGLSAPASESVIRRFLNIGTLVRRVGDASSTLMQGRKESERSRAPTPPEAYALAGAADEILTWVGQELKEWAETQGRGKTLLASWGELEVMERLLGVLADVFHCGPRRFPPFRSVLPPLSEGSKTLARGSSSGFILSELHAHLMAASEAQEPLLVRAVLSWLMERTSEGWRSGVASWIGMAQARGDEVDLEGFDGVETATGKGEVVKIEPWAGAEMEKTLNHRGEEDAGYIIRPARVPSFVTLSDARDLLEAGRALRLLRKAAPEGHPLLSSPHQLSHPNSATKLPSWLSSSEEQASTLAACVAQSRQVRLRIAQWRIRRGERQRTSSVPSSSLRASTTSAVSALASSMRSSGAPMALGPVSFPTLGFGGLLGGGGGSGMRAVGPEQMLSIFNQAPDAEAPSSALAPANTTSHTSSLRSVLIAVLSRNSDDAASSDDSVLRGQLSIAPYLTWSRLVNNALTSVYFRDLALATYLDVCQRFLLLGSASFASRISDCLFSDAWERGGGVGLSVKLNEAPTWPPSSASISSILTAAILESVQEMRVSQAVSSVGSDNASGGSTMKGPVSRNEGESHRQALRDLDERLSFAIVRPDWLVRNSDEARAERWKDRRAIEALDWLTLSFQPPPLIAPLLTAQAQMSYQRLFTFLLRLIRVQTAMRGLWRCSVLRRRGSGSETTRKDAHMRLLLALAHQARAFVDAYHTYVVHQLQSSWASFMARLGRLREDAEARDEDGAKVAEAEMQRRRAEEEEGHEVDFAPSERDGADTTRGGFDEEDEDEAAHSRKERTNDGLSTSSYQLKDIFSIARYHESLLNGMLERCFLRQRQKGVSRIFSDLFGLCLCVAQLGTCGRFLQGDGDGEEEMDGKNAKEKEEELESLAHRFRSKLSLLVRALELFRDRNGPESSLVGAASGNGRRGVASARPQKGVVGGFGGLGTTTTTMAGEGKGVKGRQGQASAEMARQEAEAEADLRALEQDVRKSNLSGDEALTALIDALSA